jgi:hypothetical protein
MPSESWFSAFRRRGYAFECRAVSSAGRAPALQAGGRRFDPVTAQRGRPWKQGLSRSGGLLGEARSEVSWKAIGKLGSAGQGAAAGARRVSRCAKLALGALAWNRHLPRRRWRSAHCRRRGAVADGKARLCRRRLRCGRRGRYQDLPGMRRNGQGCGAGMQALRLSFRPGVARRRAQMTISQWLTRSDQLALPSPLGLPPGCRRRPSASALIRPCSEVRSYGQPCLHLYPILVCARECCLGAAEGRDLSGAWHQAVNRSKARLENDSLVHTYPTTHDGRIA